MVGLVITIAQRKGGAGKTTLATQAYRGLGALRHSGRGSRY